MGGIPPYFTGGRFIPRGVDTTDNLGQTSTSLSGKSRLTIKLFRGARLEHLG